MAKRESINHPVYYGGAHNLYEAIKVIRAWNLGFSLGNTVKYISRAGKKNPAKLIEDLQKAAWYLNEEIEFLKRTGEKAHAVRRTKGISRRPNQDNRERDTRVLRRSRNS